MRPAPIGSPVYSLESSPKRSRRHSSESAAPVETAMFGMSPSVWFFGIRSFVPASAAALFSVHSATFESVYCIRHLPTWTMSGMFLPTGMSFRVKLPASSVRVLTTGAVYQDEQVPQDTPLGRVIAAVFGT